MPELNFSPLELARRTLEEYLSTGEIPSLPEEDIKAGAFVSIKTAEEGKLRGCMGTIEPVTDSVSEEIARNAISAAEKDPRFAALSREELERVKITVDVLGEKEPVSEISQLDPQKFGVIVEKNNKRGVLLPALEDVDTAKKQLEIACKKAGISAGELDNPEVNIYRFPVTRYEEES